MLDDLSTVKMKPIIKTDKITVSLLEEQMAKGYNMSALDLRKLMLTSETLEDLKEKIRGLSNG